MRKTEIGCLTSFYGRVARIWWQSSQYFVWVFPFQSLREALDENYSVGRCLL